MSNAAWPTRSEDESHSCEQIARHSQSNKRLIAAILISVVALAVLLTLLFPVPQMLPLFLGGGVAGIALNRRGTTITQWLVLVLIAAFVIHFSASMYIMAVDDPWRSGGTISKHHPGLVLPAPINSLLDSNIVVLILGSSFVFGLAAGSSEAFLKAERGPWRLVACTTACVIVLGLTWLLILAFWI